MGYLLGTHTHSYVTKLTAQMTVDQERTIMRSGRRILNSGVKEYLKKLWPKILKGIPGVEMLEQNIQVDHIHTIIIIPPKYLVSDVIGRIKGRSASKLRKQFK
jgi:REP element-mobilizing transposase RayT